MIATQVRSPFIKAFFACVMFFTSEAFGLTVPINVTPGTLNLGSEGAPITCSVTLPEPYHSADVVSITLEGVAPYSTSGDGTFTCKFDRPTFEIMLAPYAPGEVVLTMIGTLADGTTIEGTDTITVKFGDIVITSSAGPNGSISPSGTTTVTYGSDLTFTATPDTGYHVDTWSVDGGVVQTGGISYTLADIQIAHTVSVTFEINTYTLTYSAGANGSISGATPQTVNHGADGTAVTAVPDTGYHFVNWSDGSTTNPRTDTNVTADVTVTANFEINTYTLTYSAGANGSISGATPQTVNHGADGTAVTAVPDTGYHFVNWSDGSTTNPRTDTNVTADVTVTANFEINTYTLTYSAGANGSISGATPQTVNHGADGTAVTAVPDTGYHFVNWSDGSTTNPRTDTNVTADISVTANFEINTYTLTYSAGANGSISGATPQTVNHGADGTAVTAVPDTGYHFVNWSDGSTTNPRTDTGVTADIAVTANFEINTYTLTYSAGAHGSISGATPQTVNHGASGTAVTAVPDTGYHFVNWSDGSTDNPRTDTSVTADLTVTANFDALEYEVTGISGGNGSIAPAGTTTVTHGGDLAFTATPDTSYQVDTWSVDGSVVQTGGTSYTLTDIQAAHTVEVTFRLIEYTITSIAGSGGSISPAGDTTVIHGDGLVFTATAGVGHEIRVWSLDGVVVQTGGTSFTLSDIQADHTVEVAFSQISYTITATPGPGGLVTPVSIDVHYGGNHTFTATPNVGYQVDTWSLDGSVVKIGGLTYELSPIYTEHEIHVTFRNMLSYSLGMYEFEDEEETEAGVINNNSDLDLPDEALVLIEPVGLGPDPDNKALGLRNRTDSSGRRVNARAKGMFIGTGADEVLIRFKYLFTIPDTMLVIYLSSSPELLAKDDPLWKQHYLKVAQLMAPPYPRPGSPDSGRFGVFQKIVWTGHLDCSEGLYIELELIELGGNAISLYSAMPKVPNRRVSTGTGSSSVYVDDWTPIIQCYGICLDINWDNFVDEADFLMVIGGSGCSATGEMACFEGAFSTDGYMDSYDTASWDWAMNSDQRLLNYCGLPLTGGAGGISLMSVPGLGPANVGAGKVAANVPNDLGDMLIVGKRGTADAAGKLKDSLYVFDSSGQCGGSFEPASNRGNIRLVQGHDGQIYVLNTETGLVRLDSTDEVVIPPGKVDIANEPRYNKSASVYVGIQGDDSDAFGRPILDVAFDAEHAYVIPVVVHPDGGEAYTAAAKLKLSAGANPPYELVELYDEPPLPNDNQFRDSLREIEIDSAGNVYVLNVHALNESDILWRYGTDGTFERLDLGWPDGGSFVPAPVGMHFSETTGMLYLASSTYNQTDPDSTVIYCFSTQGALALTKTVTINGLQHVTGVTEDPATSTLWITGFNMHDIPQYPNPTKPPFYYPQLAKISADDDSVEVIPLFDPASHDLALPMSILWTGIVERNGVE